MNLILKMTSNDRADNKRVFPMETGGLVETKQSHLFSNSRREEIFRLSKILALPQKVDKR
jgi:hypothetical protein